MVNGRVNTDKKDPTVTITSANSRSPLRYFTQKAEAIAGGVLKTNRKPANVIESRKLAKMDNKGVKINIINRDKNNSRG
jgi:hypothetical protein